MPRRLIVLFVAAALTLLTAPAPAHAAVTRTLADGRVYDLHRQPGTDARPLVVVLHGLGGSRAQMPGQTGWTELADARGFHMAYAQALTTAPLTGGSPVTAWNSGGCCQGQAVNDVAYLKALVADARRTVAVSDAYVVGFSNGGMMVARAACQLPNLFRGVGIAGGTLDPGGEFSCTAGVQPLTVRHLHGAADDRVPVDQPARQYAFRPGAFPSSLTEQSRFATGALYSARLDLPCGHVYPRATNACAYDATADFAAAFGLT